MKKSSLFISVPIALIVGFGVYLGLIRLGVLPNASALPELVVRVYEGNPFYWTINGQPTLLRGGSDGDSLWNYPAFQGEALLEHLDALQAAGGNYIRAVMGSREQSVDGIEAVYPFARISGGELDGIYDLEVWNEEYFERLAFFLNATRERGLVVQLEFWDRYEYHGSSLGRKYWANSPWNPERNINYDVESSGLPVEVTPANPGSAPTTHPFFYTTPAQDDNQVVLPFQRAWFDRVVDLTLEHDHIIYSIGNESPEPFEWVDYWLDRLRGRAAEAGQHVDTTDMKYDNNIHSGATHVYVHENPDRYTFIDISQVSAPGVPLDGFRFRIGNLRNRLREAGTVRPLNLVKIYGTNNLTLQKFWAAIFQGAAAVRFHRPIENFGLGLGEVSTPHIASAALLDRHFAISDANPDREVFLESDNNEALALRRNDGNAYALLFTGLADSSLRLALEPGRWQQRWIDVSNASLGQPQNSQVNDDGLLVSAPGEGFWLLLLERN